jgi:menaquinol-cytochrome c reductase iron-sulfur subunit
VSQLEPPEQSAGGFYTPIGTRRRFFNWVISAVSAIIGVSLAVPLAGYVMSPAFRRRAQPWVEVGSPSELAPGDPKQLDYIQAVQDGWMTTKIHKAVWAVKQPDGEVTVFSPICPHLGCGFHWDAADHKFKCPCHGSVYDLSGNVLAGPAPRPLDVLPAKVENDRLLVIYKEFKAGLSKPVEV